MYRIKTEINYGIQLNCKVGKFKGSQGKYFVVWIILWIIIKKKKKNAGNCIVFSYRQKNL